MEKLKNPSFINELSRTISERELMLSNQREQKLFTYSNPSVKSISNEYTDQNQNKLKTIQATKKPKSDDYRAGSNYEQYAMFSNLDKANADNNASNESPKTPISNHVHLTTFKCSPADGKDPVYTSPTFKPNIYERPATMKQLKNNISTNGNHTSMYATITKLNTLIAPTLKLSSFLNVDEKLCGNNDYSFNICDYEYANCIADTKICNISNATSDMSTDSSTGYSSMSLNINQKHVAFVGINDDLCNKPTVGVLV